MHAVLGVSLAWMMWYSQFTALASGLHQWGAVYETVSYALKPSMLRVSHVKQDCLRLQGYLIKSERISVHIR